MRPSYGAERYSGFATTTLFSITGVRVISKRCKTDNPDEWTEIAVLEVEYELELKDSLFTLSNLRNPRN